jgi:hypothetical protein
MGFLGHVRRGVVASERVLGQQQAEQEHIERAVPPGVVHDVGEHEARRLVMRGREREHPDDDQHAKDVPPHADVVEQGDQPDPELVHDPVHQQHQSADPDGVPVRRGDVPLKAE